MQEFGGKIAAITGGGTGMGRELARQLVAEGCNVAICDVSEANMAETRRLCEIDASQGTRITTHLADVSIEADILKFRSEVAEQMETDHIHLLFNNAGIGGSGSLFTDSREKWERIFNICWYGVYYSVRAFLPMLQKASEARIVNTSSINGFWASGGADFPIAAYAAAKFAVRGFTEALITDLSINAPHIKCAVVMPGHVATAIVGNSRKVMAGVQSDLLTPGERADLRTRFKAKGMDEGALTDEALQDMFEDAERATVALAPLNAAQAAKIILDGVRAGDWRIFIGDDAKLLDQAIRATPDQAYTEDFFNRYAPVVMRKARPA